MTIEHPLFEAFNQQCDEEYRKQLVDKIVSVLRWSEDICVDYNGNGKLVVTNKTGIVIDKLFDSEPEALDAIFEFLANKIADEVLR